MCRDQRKKNNQLLHLKLKQKLYILFSTKITVKQRSNKKNRMNNETQM